MLSNRRLFRAVLATGGLVWASSAIAQSESVDLLPLLDVSRGQNSEPSNILGSEHRSPVGGYVRFWVERSNATSAATRRMYSDERRTWLQRLFVGRSHSRLLTARLVVNRTHVVTQTVTLAAASHDSNRRQGENWSSELGDRRFLTPFFRVDPGVTASIEVALSSSARVDSDITRNILSVVERGARLAAPTSPLVTSLTSPRLTESADFVDSSISRLFGQAIAERSQSDFAAEGWDDASDDPLATISAFFPMGRHLWNAVDARNVGEWSVRVSQPIVSIFSSIPLHAEDEGDEAATAVGAPTDSCEYAAPSPSSKDESQPTALVGHDRQACLAFTGLVPSQVLGLSVGENVTLGQSLRGDAGIIAALQRYENSNSKSQAAGEACELVAGRAEALGLNAYDSAATVWAFASSGGFSPEISRDVWNGGCAAARLAARLNLSLNTISAAQPHQEADGSESDPVTEPGPQNTGTGDQVGDGEEPPGA